MAKKGSFKSTVIGIAVLVIVIGLTLFVMNSVRPLTITDLLWMGASLVTCTLLTILIYFVILPKVFGIKYLEGVDQDG